MRNFWLRKSWKLKVEDDLGYLKFSIGPCESVVSAYCFQDLKSVFNLDASVELFRMLCNDLETNSQCAKYTGGDNWQPPVRLLKLTRPEMLRIRAIIQAIRDGEPYKHFLG